MDKLRVLIVEDDAAIREGLLYALEHEGYNVRAAGTSVQAEAVLSREDVDLCIFDVTLPDGSGYELCKTARRKSDLPIIFLTACDAEVNVIMGLEMGGDDYIVKPFRIRELLCRIQSVLRRYGKNNKSEKNLSIGHLRICTSEARVYRMDEEKSTEEEHREVPLTALEYRLLLTFAKHRGQTLSRDQLLESIWDVSGDFVNDNTVTVYVKRLREKLEKDPQNPQLIQTVRGIGYRIAR